ncbi:MAG TPA: ABC transporter ATP-binding protein [Acidimicrobiales bacterium]|nr:ABC transporter ATP-binding protein [Acidimicrobiales bacterium]
MAKVTESQSDIQAQGRTHTPVTPAVELRSVSLAYHGHVVLRDIDLTVEPGEIVAIVGPSGSGKSSLLRALGGFLDPSSGSLLIDGELVADGQQSTPPEHRRVGFVFQQYALWPHMSVRENVSYPWRTRGVDEVGRNRLADELLDQVGLKGLENRSPSSLSGGQQQRVALARGLAGDPRLLLLDEPLSSVDAARRDELQSLIGDVVRARNLTTLITTHDQREATTLADRIVVLGDGAIAQSASPLELHDDPANGFVAQFMGALNVFDIEVVDFRDGRLVAKLLDGSGEIIARASNCDFDAKAVLVARPESIRLTSVDAGDQEGVVLRSVLNDGRSEVRILTVSGIMLRAFEPGMPTRVSGERVGLVLENCSVLKSEE